MNTTPRNTPSLATSLTAAALAALCTAVQLAGVAALAEHGTAASAAPQIVQLERVVVTGKRIAAAPEAPLIAAAAVACDRIDATRC